VKKRRDEYDSPLDTLITLAKKMSVNESRYQMSSEDFFDKFSKGLLEDSIDFIEWSNDYQHYTAVKFDIERHLQNVA
jgi:hypothetical protein